VEGVERVGCTGLALAPATVAGVDDEGRAGQSIPDLAASASAFHGVLRPMVARTRGSCHSVRPVETDLPGLRPILHRVGFDLLAAKNTAPGNQGGKSSRAKFESSEPSHAVR